MCRPFIASGILFGVCCSLPSIVSTPWRTPTAFQSSAHWRILVPRHSRRYQIDVQRTKSSTTLSTSSSNVNNIFDKIAKKLGITQSMKQEFTSSTTTLEDDTKQNKGSVVRTAARPYQTDGSIPSSSKYTTRKPSLPMISLTEGGVSGDYNHYRTTALKSTPNRAISILTRDVSAYINSLDNGYFASKGNSVGYRDGDLGENVLIEGVDFSFFQIGQRYRFSMGSQQSGGEKKATTMDDVIIEITEPMDPCANLCKLPYINNPNIASAKERVGRCQYFITALFQKEGLRGWYAKVIQGGVIRLGDSLSLA